VGTGVAQGWQGNEPPSVDEKPAAKDGHSRKSRGIGVVELEIGAFRFDEGNEEGEEDYWV